MTARATGMGCKFFVRDDGIANSNNEKLIEPAERPVSFVSDIKNPKTVKIQNVFLFSKQNEINSENVLRSSLNKV
ncbi:hypothetical protein ACYPKM_01020 [Pseudomonas aeruginosa]